MLGQLAAAAVRRAIRWKPASPLQNRREMDWVSRYVLAWHLSNMLEASFCIDGLDEPLGKDRPQIFNTDQASQFRRVGL
jgi:hypothetical protein